VIVYDLKPGRPGTSVPADALTITPACEEAARPKATMVAKTVFRSINFVLVIEVS
jgi:hypothetical protein